MGRGLTSDEFRIANGTPYWSYYGGSPGDPGIVTDEAREIGDREGLDAEKLDDEAAGLGWEFHDSGYREAIEQAALRLKAANVGPRTSGLTPPLPVIESKHD